MDTPVDTDGMGVMGVGMDMEKEIYTTMGVGYHMVYGYRGEPETGKDMAMENGEMIGSLRRGGVWQYE